MFEAAQFDTPLDTILATDSDIFSHYLQMHRARLKKQPALLSAVNQLKTLGDNETISLDIAVAEPLLQLGIITGQDNYRLQYKLYRRL
jgi:hypothetical protein